MMRTGWVLAAVVAASSVAHAEPPEQRILALVNHYRQVAGVGPVRLDARRRPSLSSRRQSVTGSPSRRPT
jgi:hypothetical protein